MRPAIAILLVVLLLAIITATAVQLIRAGAL